MKKRYLLALTTTLAMAWGMTANAAPVTPDCASFGLLSAANFGGSGIPNNAVCYTTVGGVTLGLTATQRYENPAPTNDGAGTFFATAGGDTADGQSGYAMWNFDFFAENLTSGSINLDLLYDFDPAAGTDSSNLGQVVSTLGAGQTVQDSWNLGMAFLGTSGSGITAPSGTFNPNAAGQYSFELTASNGAAVAMNVNANSVPEPNSLALLFVGLAAVCGLLVIDRRQRSVARTSSN